jgi:hypothetical protein
VVPFDCSLFLKPIPGIPSPNSSFQGLRDPIDEEILSKFKRELESPDVDPNLSYLTEWDFNNKHLIRHIGNPDNKWEKLNQKLSELEGKDGDEKKISTIPVNTAYVDFDPETVDEQLAS